LRKVETPATTKLSRTEEEMVTAPAVAGACVAG